MRLIGDGSRPGRRLPSGSGERPTSGLERAGDQGRARQARERGSRGGCRGPRTRRADRVRAPLPRRPRLPDRPPRSAPFPGRARPIRLLQRPLRRPGRGDDHRHRRPQAGQRWLRPSVRGQPDPAGGRDHARADPGDRHRRPPLGRRVRGPDAADRRQRGDDACRGTPDRGRGERTADDGCRGGDDQRRDRNVRPQTARQLRGRPRRRRPGDVHREAGRARPDRAVPRPERKPEGAGADQDDDRPDSRRPHPQPPLTSHPADPQPRRRGHRALRAAAEDGRRKRHPAPGRLLHRGRGALGDGPGARPLGRGPRARADGRARARGPAGFAPRQPLGRLDHRPLGPRIHRTQGRRRGRRPLGAAPSRSRGRPRSRTTTPRSGSPIASPSSAARSRSTTTAPASAPSII